MYEQYRDDHVDRDHDRGGARPQADDHENRREDLADIDEIAERGGEARVRDGAQNGISSAGDLRDAMQQDQYAEDQTQKQERDVVDGAGVPPGREQGVGHVLSPPDRWFEAES